MEHVGYEKHEKEQCHGDLVLKLMPEKATDLVNKITGEVTPNGKRASWAELETPDRTELI